MRVTQPKTETQEVLPLTNLKIKGCLDLTVGFDLLTAEPTVSRRRYCNKVLVHECVSVNEIDPIALARVEFLATDDPCYKVFNIFKSSDAIDDIDPTIELQLNDDDLVIGILVNFKESDTTQAPNRMSYRINGYTEDDERVDLAQGTLYVSPGSCVATTCPDAWVDVQW